MVEWGGHHGGWGGFGPPSYIVKKCPAVETGRIYTVNCKLCDLNEIRNEQHIDYRLYIILALYTVASRGRPGWKFVGCAEDLRRGNS